LIGGSPDEAVLDGAAVPQLVELGLLAADQLRGPVVAVDIKRYLCTGWKFLFYISFHK
jgi:hypothetical protein